jgi:hypothetical protein
MDPAQSGMLDYTDLVGCFLFWSPKGQVFALSQFLVSPDFARIVPQVASANFHVLYPLLSGMTESNIVLVVHPGEHAHGYFLTELKAGPTRKTVKVFQEPAEIVSNAIASQKFPVIHFGELQQAVLASRRNKSPLSLRIRFLELRAGLERPLLEAISDTFIANTATEGDKERRLEFKLATLDRELKRTMVEDFLVKCLWLNPATQHLGKMICNDEKSGFSKFVTGDEQITAFGRSVERDSEGQYEVQSGVANVLPTLLPDLKWNSPTLHVYDESFRQAHRLREYYSLYAGLKALCSVGAPVLVHESYELPNSIPVHLLKPSSSRGVVAQLSVREFPIRHLVWDV